MWLLHHCIFFGLCFGINKLFFVENITSVTHFMKSSVHGYLGNFYSSMQCVVCAVMNSLESMFYNNPVYDSIFKDTRSSWQTCSFHVTSLNFILLFLLNYPIDVWLQHAKFNIFFCLRPFLCMGKILFSSLVQDFLQLISVNNIINLLKSIIVNYINHL